MNFSKLIMNVALTGIVPTKEKNPYLPITPKEIAADAKRVYDLGASIVHIHARDENGLPSHKKEIYKEIIERIREKCDALLITASTSGRRSRDIRERMEVLELEGACKPDMASITLGSLNFMEDYALNAPQAILSLLNTMNSSNIRPEIEIFDTGMANLAKYLFKKGHLKGTLYSNLILGSLGTMPATPKNLNHLIDELPESLIWGATGVGRFAFRIQSLSIAMGGHVRVGLEDSIYMDEDKREPATNEKLVLRAVKVAEAVGRDMATPLEVRALLGL
jgi:3-keto-5-aminohexanoate cleavage enzyme